jgi:hypothetical protein
MYNIYAIKFTKSFFLVKIIKKEKSPSAKCQRVDDFLAPPIGQLQNF